MKAIVLVKDGSATEAFETQELPKPEVKPHEVLVKVSHFGLNYADVMARKGMYNDRPELPCVLGYEVVGHIEALGAEVEGFAIGDYVLGLSKFGGYAEYCALNCRGVVKLPVGTDAGEATALGTQYCTAWFAACMMVNLIPGDRVLVHAAAGGVGTALVQIAKWKGCEVFGTASKPEKLDYLKTLGVDHPINYAKEPFDEAVKKRLKGQRIDVAFDPIGGSNFKKTFALVGSGGRIVTFGASEWSASSGSFIDKLKLAFGFGIFSPIGMLMKSRAVIGVNMLRIGENKPEYMSEALAQVMQHHASGVLHPAVDSVFNAADIDKAHERLESRGSIGKVVVAW